MMMMKQKKNCLKNNVLKLELCDVNQRSEMKEIYSLKQNSMILE